MRSRLILLAACVLALLAPSTASAKFTVGISENQQSMFYDPMFQSVGFKQARVIVGYDIALDPSGSDYGRFKEYLAAARSSGVEPLVSFEHSRGDASICNKRANLKRAVCKLPSQAA